MTEKPDTVLRALRMVASFGRPCTAQEFAKSMWPDSSGWQKPAKKPKNGITHGAVMITAGAAFLGRMVRSGLIERYGDVFRMSPVGAEYLMRGGRPIEQGLAFPLLPMTPWHMPDEAGCDGPLYYGPTGCMTWNGFRYVPLRS